MHISDRLLLEALDCVWALLCCTHQHVISKWDVKWLFCQNDKSTRCAVDFLYCASEV